MMRVASRLAAKRTLATSAPSRSSSRARHLPALQALSVSLRVAAGLYEAPGWYQRANGVPGNPPTSPTSHALGLEAATRQRCADSCHQPAIVSRV